ncbi:polysaccharide deacetylase family protein [Paraburkholderia sp. Ac-20336]|uniref:polysaccharide deacetylase family protein n=3 Tax=Burkholderiales TaxID=80840 RepID=UPI0014228A0C|nr:MULTISPECIES: polysaccharide deacetylase family protein [Burkholderiaceae]MBN3803932.1 polysaccharide deacetylase family protein [Paraburkholderia sp. Ac-20336]NIF53448.1 polysaccharide deacetylase family protein [Burkholderia sp. Ax-1724]
MQLPHHNRYSYSPIVERQNYSWPEGKRLAFYIGLNIEHFAFGTGLSHSLSTPLPGLDHRAFTWCDYGNRIGVWRIFKLLDELGLPACHLMNTAVFDYAPQIVEAIRTRGDEIIGHGRTNSERQGQMWEQDEIRLLQHVREQIQHHAKQEVRGWMSPWMSVSHQTPDLLRESGYKFLMDWPGDDQPIWMQTRSGPILSLPYPFEINDSPQVLVRHHSAEEFERMIVDQFEEMLEQSEEHPLVCGVALHTMIVGQPYRLRAIKRALKYIVNHANRDKVWFTRPGEIYDHVARLPSGVVV